MRGLFNIGNIGKKLLMRWIKGMILQIGLQYHICKRTGRLKSKGSYNFGCRVIMYIPPSWFGLIWKETLKTGAISLLEKLWSEPLEIETFLDEDLTLLIGEPLETVWLDEQKGKISRDVKGCKEVLVGTKISSILSIQDKMSCGSDGVETKDLLR